MLFSAYKIMKNTFLLWFILFFNHGKIVITETAPNLITNQEVDCHGGTLLSARICLPYGYRKGELPGNPVEIKTSISINHIREIDDKKMTVALEFHPVLVWVDNRIITNLTENERKYGAVLNNAMLFDLWKPDLRIENIRSFHIHSILEDISGLAIGGMGNNTVIWYEFTAKAIIYCNFDFHRYPMDVQECNFTIGSPYPSKEAVIFKFNASAFHFATDTQNTDAFDIDIKSIKKHVDEQTTFGFTIKMTRTLQKYVMECYIPCITIVIVAQVSFIISFESIPGRIGLLITLFLTLTNICIYQQKASPSAGNFTALGIYLLTCLFFVTLAIMEFAFLLHLKYSAQNEVETFPTGIKPKRKMIGLLDLTKKKPANFEVNYGNRHTFVYQENNDPIDVEVKTKSNPRKTFIQKANKIDRIALIVFNCSFLLFNLIYWEYYLWEY